jgi:hypothetical protein
MTLKQCVGYGVASIDVVYVRQDDINRSAMNDRRSRSSQPYVLLSCVHFASRNIILIRPLARALRFGRVPR